MEILQYIDDVLDKNSVMEINIDIDEASFEDLKANATAEEYYEVDITINGVTYNGVGIRSKENSSLTSIARDETTDRYSFKLNFDKYVDGQTYNGIEKYYGSVEGNLYKPETMDMNKIGMGQNGGNMMKPDFQAMPNNQGIENNLDGQMPVPNGEMNGNMPTMPDMSNMPNFENMPNMEDMPNVEGSFKGQIPQWNIPDGFPEDFMNKGNGKMPNMMGRNLADN